MRSWGVSRAGGVFVAALIAVRALIRQGAKDLTIVCQMVGFDPFLGFYHQPRFGRAPTSWPPPTTRRS